MPAASQWFACLSRLVKKGQGWLWVQGLVLLKTALQDEAAGSTAAAAAAVVVVASMMTSAQEAAREGKVQHLAAVMPRHSSKAAVSMRMIGIRVGTAAANPLPRCQTPSHLQRIR
jgi:hypothetical protein